MSAVILAAAVLQAALIGGNLIRVARGPTFYDRLLGVGVIGTNAVLLLVLIGFVFGRPGMFLDLAITYAILNFIGVVGVAKFLDLETAPGGPRAALADLEQPRTQPPDSTPAPESAPDASGEEAP